MADIAIEWLSDTSDCECCGMNWAEGATVTIDGEIALDLKPAASCFGGDHYDRDEVLARIITHLGHSLTQD